MASGHSHSPEPATGSATGRYRWRLGLTFGLVASFFVVELLSGILSNSLSLITDAGHMAADVVALGAALVATKIATRPDKSGRRSYGSYRAEVFASGLTVLIMLGVAAYVVMTEIVAQARHHSTPELQQLAERIRPAELAVEFGKVDVSTLTGCWVEWLSKTEQILKDMSMEHSR